jgi:CubicO group peptidase (beta-lactamase class C family)
MSSASLLPLPSHPAGVSWPTKDWEMAEPGGHVDRAKLDLLVDRGFGSQTGPEMGETHALLVVQHGKIVAEHYRDDFTATSTFPSWSKAKSITQALIGILVREGKIDIHARADVPEWQDPSDPRHAITLDQLLRMSSGLAFREEYTDQAPSDVIEMLWGAGKEDTGAFAASFPLEHGVGSSWSYSSGTTNIVARCAARALGVSGAEFETFMRRELLDPIGMASADPKFDDAGTFIGSSFCFATARDFAKFGTLYLRDGVWDGRRILPEGWVDYARTPTPQTPEMLEADGAYGAHWWLERGGPGSFSANGFEGQFTIVVPDCDLVMIRHGKTDAALGPNMKAWMADVVDCFRS